MKTYRGRRLPTGRVRVTVNRRGSEIEAMLAPRFELANHSPGGFEWGYLGSGPSQLALALLADALRDDARALALYQDFKRAFVALLDPSEAWTITDAAIVARCHEIEMERAG
ncbi:MAG: hypothetical protein GC206_13270 [Alphaproteobacteria bacterium]|nr:hypothetical protein [Alphaproteobacteria bacterium]